MKTQQNPLSFRKLTKRQWTLIVVATVLVGGFLGRGWIRVTVTPAIVSQTHGKAAQKVMNEEMEKLGQPLMLLGYDTVEPNEMKCSLGIAKRLSTSFYCSYGFKAYRELSTNQADKDAMNQNAAALMESLQANGWDGDFNDDPDHASLVELVKNLNDGIDYTPDAAYLKTIGDVTCLFDSNTAYATPSPVAMASHFTCSREVNVFGRPVLPNMLYGPDHIDQVIESQ